MKTVAVDLVFYQTLPLIKEMKTVAVDSVI